MSEKLIIRNFGPIKEVKLDLKKVNVLIGEQASGKSTILKVLAVCRYFSYIVNYKEFGSSIADQGELKVNDQFYQGLVYWGLREYLKNDFEIEYQSELYHFYAKKSVGINLNLEPPFFNIQTKLENCSPEFKRLLEDLKNLRVDELETSKKFDPDFDELSWTPNENFYRLNVRKVMNKPFYFPTERAIQTNSFNGLNISEACIDELIQLDNIIKRTTKEWKIPHLAVTYKNINGIGYVKKDSGGENDYYTLHNGASGYQASIPIVLGLLYFRINQSRRTFFIEEPELNLFPKAQKSLMGFLVSEVRDVGYNRSLLMTTHSPYVLSSLNNLLYAHTIGHIKDGAFKEQANKIINEKYWMNPDDLEVYYLNEEGVSKSIIDRKENLINTDYIDSVSEIINKEFDKLLSIEVKNNPEND